MRKRHYLLITVILALGYVIACEKPFNFKPDFPSISHIQAVDSAIIDTIIYDVKVKQKSVSRSGDGYYDFVVLCDGYKGNGGLDLATLDFGIYKMTMLQMFATQFDSINLIDTSKFRFHFRNVKQNLGCTDNSNLNEGISCNVNKIISIVNDMAQGFTVDHVAVFLNGKGGGGSDGSIISVTGFGSHTTVPNICPLFYQGAMGKAQHEFWHCEGSINHTLIPDNKLGSCINGCCFILNAPILPQHQANFKQKFDGIVN